MSDLRKAAEIALEPIEFMFGENHDKKTLELLYGEELVTRFKSAIKALRQALAQPDYWQEEARRYASNADYWRSKANQTAPVDTVNISPKRVDEIEKRKHEPVVGTKTWFEDGNVVTQNLYASDIYKDLPKREWVGLTNSEIHNTEGYEEDRKLFRFAQAIEAKLKEKNGG